MKGYGVGGERRRGLWRMVAGRVDGEAADGWPSAVCLVCVATLGVDAAALTLRGAAHAQELLAASDPWAESLVGLQYTVGEGPGVESFSRGEPVLAADLRVEQVRWPGFAREAMRSGAGAMFAFPLQQGGLRFGVLELFRRGAGGLASSGVVDGALLASLVMDALLDDAEEADRTGREWPRPADSYQDVNMAIGMVAAQLRISLEDAFVRLRAYAFTQGRTVKDVAGEVLARRVSLDELVE